MKSALRVILLLFAAATLTGCMSVNAKLIQAARNGHTETAKRLIEKGANVNVTNQFGSTPLIEAVRNGHTDIAKRLIEQGANINVTNQFGSTPLIDAARSGHTEIAKLLIEKGANVNAGNQDGNTPLIWATANGHMETAKLLIEQGANVNAANKYGATPLILVARDGRTETAKLLIENGANVNAVGKYGNTSLILAAFNGHTEIAKLLLNAGADPKILDNEGQTAAQAAREKGHHELARMLDAVTAPKPVIQPQAQQQISSPSALTLTAALPKRTWKDVENMAVAELTVVGIEAETKMPQFLTDLLHAELVESGYFAVVAQSDVILVLEQQAFQRSGACDDSACLVEMGRILSVSKIIGGTIGRLGQTYSISLRLVDVETARTEITVTEKWKGDVDDILTLIPNAARKLCAEYARRRD